MRPSFHRKQESLFFHFTPSKCPSTERLAHGSSKVVDLWNRFRSRSPPDHFGRPPPSWSIIIIDNNIIVIMFKIMSENHHCNCYLFVFHLQSKYAAFEACKMKHVQRSSKTPKVQIKKLLEISSNIQKLASSVKLGMWQVLVGPWRRPSQIDGSPFHFQTILVPVLGLRRSSLHHLII